MYLMQAKKLKLFYKMNKANTLEIKKLTRHENELW